MPALVVSVLLFVLLRAFAAEHLAAIVTLDLVVLSSLGAATFSYSRHDPPRLGWGLMFGAQLLLVGAHFAERSGVGSDPIACAKIVANVLWVAAVFVFVRMFRSSGLAPEWNRTHRVLVGGAVVFALGVTIQIISLEIAGESTPLLFAGALVSTGADAGVFVGAVLLTRMLLPMSGGRLALPYLLLSVSGALFLVMDFVMASLGTEGYVGVGTTAQVVVAIADACTVAAAINAALLTRG